MNTDTKMPMWKQEEKELVINRLTEGANEMFLWVFCQLDRLRCYLPGCIRQALDELLGSLDATCEYWILMRKFGCPPMLTAFSNALLWHLSRFELAELLFEAGWRPEDPEDAVLELDCGRR
ncbi:hypothetical protein EDB85DRAFT_2141357 [Lactarius pseudohatsudake]|nr:hypothetical protein EDB85DRAFT_2141357 [Lactarius pseudohatsudake]